MVLDNTIPDFWRGVRSGSTIRLADEPTLSRRAGGIDYTVRRIETVREDGKLVEWILLRLESRPSRFWQSGSWRSHGDDEPMLMVRIAGDDINLRVYREAGDFETGDRTDMDERDDLWMFCDPEDPDDFDVRELRYAEYIEYEVDGEYGVDSGDDNRTVRFEQKHPEQNGEVVTEPAGSGSRLQVAIVSEYAAVDVYEHPEAVILEIGSDSAMEETGGLISFMLGHSIDPTEIEVL